ncbi:AAA family ATPase [Alkalimarinus alittae]|uniref:AAA family ATPase n=1 Tax=Alkalimarinus alittae TaxID=2961619 RepID=A0ABY6MX70_9ALTE|nr:AAA family ATPase [Alkalimarinus alittae]UZE94426.1 AAA family ATPase [Alkalimarinus alittae]
MAISRRSPSQSSNAGTVDPLIQLWLLRILVPLGGYRKLDCFDFDSTGEALGLKQWVDLIDFDLKSVRNELRHKHKIAERNFGQAGTPACLASNVERLSGLVGLSDTDCRLLEFVVLINNERILDETADLLGDLSSVKLFNALSEILQIPVNQVRNALNPQGILAQSGLVSVDRRGSSCLRSKLDVLSSNFADQIFSSDADPVSLLRDTVSVSSPPQLTIKDYEHITDELNVLKPYLKKSITTSREGVNIFLHGAPGTGKSQLVKVLAKMLGCELFEVASEDEEGDPVTGEKRLRAFRAAQKFFANQKSLILFDEVEDVFNDGDEFFGRRSTAQTRKAWINRMLEESPIPTLWLSNSAACLDQAFIRRFDMVIELPVPPKRQRQRIISKRCSGFLDKQTIERIAESEALAPAVVARAASVVETVQCELGSVGVASAFELIVNNTLETQGHKPVRKHDPKGLPDTYNPAFIHSDTNTTELASGLVANKAGRLCLYGAPGTGKTAYGRWIAEQLGAPLIIKRASDLISKWVGDSEKNIALAFKEAEDEGAVLLMDEVDSFLQDRRGAQMSWEVTRVNEMLTQMESFSGVFIATTNLMDGIDQAALRRFDLKVKFDYLKPDQAWKLLARQCKSLGLPKPAVIHKPSLDGLINLTPGDFAAVARRHRFQPITSAKDMIDALAGECSIKEGVKRAIGFTH